MALVPHVSFSVRDSSQLDRPFTSIFSVSNESQVNIYDLTIKCQANNIVMKNNSSLIGLTIEFVPKTTVLEPGKSTDVRPCGIDAGTLLARADFNLIVSYRPAFWPWDKTQVSHFVTDASGPRLIWLQNPP
jgi:hypothetical protein